MKKTLYVLMLIIISQTIIAQKKTTGSGEDFSSFFQKFNKDKNFQLSRIKFPLTVKLNNDDFELVDYIISKDEHIILKLNLKNVEYKQKTIFKNNTVIIQQRGIDNGIFIDYIFDKRKGLWFLKTWVDQST
ncbi:DUF4348 domain-containing protein [Flavobacterium sp. CLA17]|uniref:DUF4348 domain-containing protein n=1 Tax=Flavobacterium sp. CLA17 TaxID=2724135 RepID=UPI0014924603|nr:DUF4348 domain-containing protein [Flavobacterium sp. CLA17]QSB25220.1 DUF4348 domain-containing protein [Flavobacterium sp. CLA17]